MLLNFSRNGLVDEEAMIQALDNGKIQKYVTDFPNPLLVNNSNVLSIPHLGASSDEAEENCAVMVANQLNSFLRDGTITNSVNFPSSMLERSTDHRITIVNQNVPNVIGQITSTLAAASLNISEMVNKSRGDIAYNIIDLDTSIDQSTIDQLLLVDGVVRVRQLLPLLVNWRIKNILLVFIKISNSILIQFTQ